MLRGGGGGLGESVRELTGRGGKRAAHAQLEALASRDGAREGGVSRRKLDHLATGRGRCRVPLPLQAVGAALPNFGAGRVPESGRAVPGGSAPRANVEAAGGAPKGPRPGPRPESSQAFPSYPPPRGRGSVEGAALDQLQLLEEELRSVREELCQCQADKEFVWSLWKFLHAANPDLTEAVSLVVEREKTKAEAKDRKVLEILQVKDARIKELQKRESGSQQEINTLVEKKIAVDEENVFLKKELSDLQKKFKDQSQELKRVQKKEEKNVLIIEELEEENKELSIRCSELLNDLENLRKQETQWRREKHDIDCKMKTSASDLTEAKRQIENSRLKCNELASQLDQKQTEIMQKDMDITLVKKELQELQNIYQQNQEYTAQQAELIRQLHVLNMDTQKVMRNQEDAHTAESISYQKLYNEVQINFEAKKATESLLQKNILCLKDQLVQKDRDIMQLTEKIDELEKTLHLVTRTPFLNNMEQEFQQPSLSSLETLMVSQQSEIDFLQEKLKIANFKLSEKSSSTSICMGSIISRTGRIYEEPPVKRSRSLSPKRCFKDSEDLKKLKAAERKIENLEKTLQLKIQENDELRDAHEKRKERLQMLQTNYRAVKEQLKQLEENYSKTDRNKQMRRGESQQLRQEDSNALWNELTYFKREHQKLLIENVNLEEELDQLKVFRSVKAAEMQEVNAYLEQQREELLYKLCEDQEVSNDTLEKKLKQKSDETLQKVIDLEKRLKAFEKKSRKLKEANKKLRKENDEIKASCKQQQDDAEAKEKELTLLQKEKEDVERDRSILEFKIRELELEVKCLKEQVAEVNSLKKKVVEINKMRQENEKLRKQLQEIEDPNQIQKVHRIQEIQGMQQMQAAQLPTRLPAQLPTQSLVQAPEVLPAQMQLPAQPSSQLQVESVQLYLNKAIPKEPRLEVVSTEQCRQCKTTTTKVKFKAAKKKGATGHPQTFLNQSIKVMSNMFENYKDDWEDVSESSDSEELTSENLGTIIVETSQKVSPRKDKGEQTEEQAEEKEITLAIESPIRKDINNKDYRRSSSQKKKISALRSAYAPATIKVKKENENNVNAKKPVASMQQQISMLQDLKKSAEASLKELKEANEKLTQQQQITDQKLQTTKQTVKKLNSDLAELRKEKEELQKKLEAANEAKSAIESPSKNMQAEIKQLQCKLKNTTNEMTKQSSNIKSLKCEVKEKEEQILEFQGKVSRMERDLVMKRHLIEHFKHRQKVNLENNDNFNDLLENLEKKVRALTEDCTNKKTAVDALKQMLNVVTKEKSHYEQMYIKAKDELERKDHKLAHLLSKMSETKSAMTELEATASQQLHGLALQSERAFEIVQIKLMRANDREEEFITFVKALVKEIQHNVQEMRLQMRRIKKIEHNKTLTKTATQKVQCLAASILNISPTDVEEMLDSEDEEESRDSKKACEQDKEWLININKILEGQFPFAACLLEAIMEKINEKKKLVEDYIKFMKAVG
ncbi:centlein [Trichosurus vulpecula]|uniref:centlein n=1 Tax=Trichosurus vulpecula TaxID=9337 RepID=UPI00186ACF5B|nr:centlein [Trichosurus vulpecula]